MIALSRNPSRIRNPSYKRAKNETQRNGNQANEHKLEDRWQLDAQRKQMQKEQDRLVNSESISVVSPYYLEMAKLQIEYQLTT